MNYVSKNSKMYENYQQNVKKRQCNVLSEMSVWCVEIH